MVPEIIYEVKTFVVNGKNKQGNVSTKTIDMLVPDETDGFDTLFYAKGMLQTNRGPMPIGPLRIEDAHSLEQAFSQYDDIVEAAVKKLTAPKIEIPSGGLET